MTNATARKTWDEDCTGLTVRLHLDDDANELWLVVEDADEDEVCTRRLGHVSVASDYDLPENCPEAVKDEFYEITGEYFAEQARISAIR